MITIAIVLTLIALAVALFGQIATAASARRAQEEATRANLALALAGAEEDYFWAQAGDIR